MIYRLKYYLRRRYVLSEPEHISPLLDGCATGSAISNHHGVCCFPAMDLHTQDKFIIKTITIPASPKQLDALLLSGAFPDKSSASAYFKELADDIVTEAEILQRLARLEGFCAHDSWQIVPDEDCVTYHVYLKSAYRPTLERFLSRNPMTHLAAVNLGLDLCSALSACRRSGYLYVDVKPSNIFICDDREYRLGDLGFVALSSLRYASLPEKYRSCYTAPEITDAYASLNTTLDTYAVGLVLYQVYNNGQLPFTGSAPTEPLPPPPYADYEMAEIILKACAPDPQDRWEDPAQMGQALVSYLQRNRVNDTPIIPPVIPEDAPVALEDQTEEVAEQADAVEETAEVSADAEPIAESEEITEEESAAEQAETAEEVPVAEQEVTVVETPVTEEAVITEEVPATEQAEIPEEEPAAEQEESMEAAPVEAEIPEETPAEEVSDSQEDDLAILDDLLQDETAPDEENTRDLSNALLSDETTQMLAQADELIAHELPNPVVAPEPIDVPIPQVFAEEPSEETEPEEDSTSDDITEPAEDSEPEEILALAEESAPEETGDKPKKRGHYRRFHHRRRPKQNSGQGEA